ncbi:tRNA (guanosine(46)-N7)-methyltransferase TrmB [Deltaproteobacteria bacterium TL4]
MQYHTTDHRNLSQAIFEKRVENNPYFALVYDYPEVILPHPTPALFREQWSNLCAPQTAVHVEIGCGSGKYLQHLNQAHPDQAFLGFELRYKRLVKAAKKFRKHQCQNILLLKERGELLPDYLPPNSMDQLHINFPDPWAKKSQRKHRLLGEVFLNAIVPLFRKEGCFHFKTDHHEYFHSVVELLEELKTYHISVQTTDLHQSVYNENNIETEFEQLFKSKDNPPIAYLKAVVR